MAAYNNKTTLEYPYITRAKCPKCSGVAYYKCVMEVDLVLHCLCGYYAVVYTEAGNITTSNVLSDIPKDMPRPDSNIGKCMTAVLNNYPDDVTSEQVYIKVMKSMCRSSVSTNLMLLQGRGILVKIKSNKGKAGGSVWGISDYGKKMYNIEI